MVKSERGAPNAITSPRPKLRRLHRPTSFDESADGISTGSRQRVCFILADLLILITKTRSIAPMTKYAKCRLPTARPP